MKNLAELDCKQNALELSIIIPAFNEALRIGPTLVDLNEKLRSVSDSREILVVNDGSRDDTAAVVEALYGTISGLRLIGGDENRGKGHALRTGMLAARGAIRVMADADGATDWRDLDALIAPIAAGDCAVVIGSRYIDGARVEVKQPWLRRVFSRLANRLIQRLLLPGVVDAHCGFKAFSADAASRLFSVASTDGWSIDLEILALCRKWELGFVEIPVRWCDDDRSQVRAGQDLWNSTAEFWQIKRRIEKCV